jgi:hypothetical protein
MPYFGSGSSMLCPPRRAAHIQAAAQHLGRQLGGELVPGPAEQVQRHQRLATHRVDVGQGVGGGDPPERVGVVHDGGEEVGGHHHRRGPAEPHHRAVVAVLHAHQQAGEVRAGAIGQQLAYRFLQLARRDLAGAAAATRVLGKPESTGIGHTLNGNGRPGIRGARPAPGFRL